MTTAPLRVQWDPRVPLLIESSLPPITPISSLTIIPRRPSAPDGVLLTVRTMGERDFQWRRISDGAPLTVGSVSTFTKQAGFEFDIFGQAGDDNQWAVVYTDAARDRMIVTRGFYLVDWPSSPLSLGNTTRE